MFNRLNQSAEFSAIKISTLLTVALAATISINGATAADECR